MFGSNPDGIRHFQDHLLQGKFARHLETPIHCVRVTFPSVSNTHGGLAPQGKCVSNADFPQPPTSLSPSIRVF